jgi:hypothetical protein
VVSLSDPRTHSTPDPDSDYTLGQIYTISGLAMSPGTTMKPRDRIDIVREWMKPEYGRPHVITGEPGFTKLMCFNNLMNFTEEVEGYRNKEQPTRRGVAASNLQEDPATKDDHLMDCLAWLCCYPLTYVELRTSSYRTTMVDKEWGFTEENTRRHVDPITKY